VFTPVLSFLDYILSSKRLSDVSKATLPDTIVATTAEDIRPDQFMAFSAHDEDQVLRFVKVVYPVSAVIALL
jgi:hypothetical protein